MANHLLDLKQILFSSLQNCNIWKNFYQSSTLHIWITDFQQTCKGNVMKNNDLTINGAGTTGHTHAEKKKKKTQTLINNLHQ